MRSIELLSTVLLVSGLAAQTRTPIPDPQEFAEPVPRVASVSEAFPDPPPVAVPAYELRQEVLDDEPDYAPTEDVRDESGHVVGVRRVGNPYVLDFVNGRYVPQPGVDPELERQLAESRDGVTWGFVMIRGRMSAEKLTRLRQAGLTLLGKHTFQSVKARIPADALATVRFLRFVHWIGYARKHQKLGHVFAPVLAGAADDAKLKITVTPFESDLGPNTKRILVGEHRVHTEWTHVDCEGAPSTVIIPNGRFHRRLNELGFEFDHYNQYAHAFVGTMTKRQILKLLDEDWVHSVEDGPGEAIAAHDQAIPMVRQDYVRKTYGGTGVTAGFIDSGIDTTPWHKDFTGMANAYWGNAINATTSHGTHVAGTILGRGIADKRYMGAAPQLGSGPTARFFFSHWNVKDSTNIANFSKTFKDKNGKESPKPSLVSCSYARGMSASGFFGTHSGTIPFDDAAYFHRQLYVIAAGNKKSVDNWWVTRPGSSKNSLTIGAVTDLFDKSKKLNPGDRWSSSRWGVRDRRTKPEVCGIGNELTSCKWNTSSGYSNGSGTSMATPLVSGCLVSRVQASAFYKYRPEALKARAVASAKNRSGLSTGTWMPPQPLVATRQTTGWGLIDSRTMTFSTSESTAFTWGGTFTKAGQSWGTTFTVPSNATRMRLVLCYTERPASVNATKARVNDTRAALDFQPYTSGSTTGDFTAFSSWDNTIVRDNIAVPSSSLGKQAKIKIWSATMPVPNVHWAVVVMVYKRNPTLSAPEIVLKGADYVKPVGLYALEAEMRSPVGFDAFRAGRLWYDGPLTSVSMFRTTQDSVLHHYSLSNLHFSNPCPLVGTGAGSGMVVGSGVSRKLTFRLGGLTDGLQTLWVRGTWDSGAQPPPEVSAKKVLCVDGQKPKTVSNLKCTTHTVGGWSNLQSITFTWSGAADNGCAGIHGTAWHLDKVSTSEPTVIDQFGSPTTTTFASALFATSTGYWFHVRGVDRAGNLGPVSHIGPFKIDIGKPVVKSVVLDNGAAQTSSLTVNVDTTAVDDRSGTQSMRFSAKAGVWTAWVPFQASRTFDLTAAGASTAAGVKTLQVQVRDQAGNQSATRSDQINYVPIPKITSVVGGVLTNNTKSYVTLKGLNLNHVRQVWFGKLRIDQPWTPRHETDWFGGRFLAQSDTELRVYPPQDLAPMIYSVQLENSAGGKSQPVNVSIIAVPSGLLLNTETKLYVGNAQHVLVSRGSSKATKQITMVSLSLGKSTIPGFVTMDIGANWTNFFLLPALPFDGRTGNSLLAVRVPPSAKGLTVYYQTLFVGSNGQPLGKSAVRGTSYE